MPDRKFVNLLIVLLSSLRPKSVDKVTTVSEAQGILAFDIGKEMKNYLMHLTAAGVWVEQIK